MKNQSWSLAKRLKLWFTGACLVPSLVAVVLGGWFLHDSVSREIEALLIEELDEAETLLASSRNLRADLASISETLANRHPEVRMAWRLVDPKTGEIIGEFGPKPATIKLAEIPANQAGACSLGEDLIGATRRTSTDLQLTLVIDSQVRSGLLRTYWITALLMTALGAVVAFGLASLLASRVSQLLAKVASNLREDDTDRSDLHRAPEEIRAVAEALQGTLSRIRGQGDEIRLFVATLAHELRSPIQNLTGRAELTLMRRREATEYQTALQEQLDELCEFGMAIDNVLSLCSAEGGDSADDGALECFDIGTEMQVRLQRERQRAERQDVQLVIETSGPTILLGDREAVLRAVRNVVANAIDWTRCGTEVRVSLVGDSKEVILTVDDSGPGVPLEMREEVFRPFLQRQQPNSQRSGFGLGLAIVKKAVEAQGGRVELTDSPTKGARFRLIFRAGRC